MDKRVVFVFGVLLFYVFYIAFVSASNVQPVGIGLQVTNFTWANVTIYSGSSLVFWENFTFASTNQKGLNLGVVKSLPDMGYNSVYNYSVWVANSSASWYIGAYNQSLGYVGRGVGGITSSSVPYWIDSIGNITSNSSINKGNVLVTGNLTVARLYVPTLKVECFGTACEACKYWDGFSLITESPCTI
jgi:hypothetical protein